MGKQGKLESGVVLCGKLPSSYTFEELEKKSKNELITLILGRQEENIPITVFLNSSSPLESLVNYLKEKKGFSVKAIATKLNRNVQTIWTTYRNSKKSSFKFSESKISVPIRIFSKTDKSVMESLVYFLKSRGMRNCEISRLLNKDSRSIHVHYQRYIMKEKIKERSRRDNT